VNAPEPVTPEPDRLRASDADRDQTAARLRDALAEGRLTPAEHAERSAAAFAARTYAELDALVADLPGERTSEHRLGEPVRPAAGRMPRREPPAVTAILSAATRGGRWLVEPESSVSCVLGSAELDFRQAVLSGRQVTLTITCAMGHVRLLVPPGVLVASSITAILGSNQTGAQDDVAADAPVIRLTGVNLLGHVSVEYRTQ
jgi:uncharacterized protein DUF1707/cell wall-active antibiotic response 4TMS protein YvqF